MFKWNKKGNVMHVQRLHKFTRCFVWHMYKFVDLLNVENPTIIKRLVVYIYKAFELRSNYNYNQWVRHLVIISKWLFANLFNKPSLNNGICNPIVYNKC